KGYDRLYLLCRLVGAWKGAGDRKQAAATARAAVDVANSMGDGSNEALIATLVQAGLIDDAQGAVEHASDRYRHSAARALAQALAKAGNLDAALDILEDGENAQLAAGALWGVQLELAAAPALERILRLGPIKDKKARIELAGRLALAL